MSLAFFPEILPDEDFRSIVFRYHILSGNNDLLKTNKELFRRTSRSNPIFPLNLDHLYSQLPDMSYDFLNNNTLFPLFKPFIPKERMTDISHAIRSKQGIAVVGSSLATNSVISPQPRYCPVCMQYDEENYGTVYLHKTHQLSFMSTCPVHNVKLITHCKECLEPLVNSDYSKLLVSGICHSGHLLVVEEENSTDTKHEIIILNQLNSLLEHSSQLKRETFFIKLQVLLRSKGYLNYTGNIDRSSFIRDFNDYLISSGLDKYYSLSSVRSLNHFIFNNNIHNILLYILLMMFLSGSVREFIYDETTLVLPIPFGTGPWNCRNKICPFFNQPVIDRCKRIDRGGKYISGLFCCPHCGFTIAMRWKWRGTENEEQFSVITSGHLWMSKFFQYRDLGLTNSQIARELKTDLTQILRVINRLNDRNYRYYKTLSALSISKEEKQLIGFDESTAETEEGGAIKRNRKEFMQIMKKCKGMNRGQISSANPALYRRLMQTDRDWMEAVLPPSEKGKVRNDWDELDRQYSEMIKKVSDALYANLPIKQIKRFTILSKLPTQVKYNINTKREKLPRSWELLGEVIESNEQYQVRHFPVTVEFMLKHGIRNVTFDKVMYFRKMYRNCSQEQRKYFEEQLTKMGY